MANAMTVVTPTSAERPGQLADDLGQHRNPLRGEAELTGEAVRDVLEVRDEQVLVDVDAELDLQRVQRRRVDAAVRGQHRRASLPGMTRGMMKLTVSAAQSVTRKRPTRRVTYLTAASAAP